MRAMVAGACLAAAVPSPAAALESRPSDAYGPSTPFAFAPGSESDTASTAGLAPTAAGRGLYVIGDSISNGVPYVRRAADAGIRAHVRQWSGWTVRWHAEVTSWPGSALTSVDDAARSGAGAVVVQLGTNDVLCLHHAPDLCPDTPPDDDAGHAAFTATHREAIERETRAVAAELLDAGRCVLWAGPRHSPVLDGDDVDFFNGLLAGLEADRPGAFTRLDLDAFSQTDPALAADYAAAQSDGVHPRTAAAREAIADWVTRSAQHACALDAAPAPPAPAPAPAPAPTVAPPSPTASLTGPLAPPPPVHPLPARRPAAHAPAATRQARAVPADARALWAARSAEPGCRGGFLVPRGCARTRAAARASACGRVASAPCTRRGSSRPRRAASRPTTGGSS